MNNELLPCPFCNSPAITGYVDNTAHQYMIKCSKPCLVNPEISHTHEEKAIDAWNKRPDPNEKKLKKKKLIYCPTCQNPQEKRFYVQKIARSGRIVTEEVAINFGEGPFNEDFMEMTYWNEHCTTRQKR